VKPWRLSTVLLLLACATPVGAETAEQVQMREAQASLYQGSLNAALSTLKSLDLVGGEAAVEQNVIREDVAMFEKGGKIFDATVIETKTKRDKLNADAASYEAALVPHNAIVDSWNARCGRTFSEKEGAAVQKCNQDKAALQPLVDQKAKEKEALTARNAALEVEEARLAQQAKDLEAIRAKLIARVEANERKGLDYLAKRAKIIAQIDEFHARLLTLQASFDACKSVLGDQMASNETVHDVCGKAFDGNRVPDKYLPDYDTTPKWSPWGDK
jgi:DNA repair exonuclease SbcCD ATPase subunit